MGRHAKGIEDTRAMLIKAAWISFSAVGYEKSTVETIIQSIGVSKGAFYHHFASKEEILGAVADEMILRSWEPMHALMEEKGLGAGEKISRFLETLRGWKLTNIGVVGEVGRALYTPENLLLLSKAQSRTLSVGVPALASIIRQGIAEKVFFVRDPESAARMILRLASAASEDFMSQLAAGPFRKETAAGIGGEIDILLETFERILGAEDGSIRRPDPAAVEALCEMIAAEGTDASHRKEKANEGK